MSNEKLKADIKAHEERAKKAKQWNNEKAAYIEKRLAEDAKKRLKLYEEIEKKRNGSK